MPIRTTLDKSETHNGASIFVGYLGDDGTDHHSFAVPAGEVVNGCSLQVEAGRYNQGARLEQVPLIGSGQSHVDVRWFFDGGPQQSFVRYRVRVTTIPRAELRPAVKVRGFLPSTSGFHFGNSFSNVIVTFNVGPVSVPLQGANGGACGGMAFAARDLFEAGFLVPRNIMSPSSGTLYTTIMNRLRDSFNLPSGPLRYVELMDPNLPDASSTPPAPPRKGRGQMLREAWSQIRADIDGDKLSALGLVLVRSLNPVDIAQNHQVLAYGYTFISDREGQIFIYDPNFPDDDRVNISFRVDDNDDVALLHSSYSGLVGFFRNSYARATPNRPALGDDIRAAFKASNGLYVVAENAGGGVVNANRAQARSWETFTIERVRRRALTSGELVNIKAADDRHYLVAENRGGGQVNCNRVTPFSWERFVINAFDSSGNPRPRGAEIQHGDSVAIRTDGDRFLRPDGQILTATGDTPNGDTRFTIEFM